MKYLKKFIVLFLVLAVVFATLFFIKSNKKDITEYKTIQLQKQTIETKIVATGKVVPKDEVEIKPQVPGIVDKILVNEGDEVKAGDLLAIIKVVPDEQALNNAQGRLKNAEIVFNNAEIEYIRNKKLFNQSIISEQTFNNIELQYNQAQQNLTNLENDLQIIKLGSTEGSSIANTNVRATVSGTILEIPIKKGDQVIQANTFNQGTTIATIANLNIMIFEGKVDEGEVSKLEKNMDLIITLAAIEQKFYPAKLVFIAPKGIDEAGAVQFKIEGEVFLDDEYIVRAGYSANATIITNKKINVDALPEAVIQYDLKTKEPYVEIETSKQNFIRKNIATGISDGINIEIISGVENKDKIKIWDITKPNKISKW